MSDPSSFPPETGEQRPSGRIWCNRWSATCLAAIVLASIAISCGTLTRTVVAPPDIPGAEYIGTTACADCHDGLVAAFANADHARLLAKGDNAIEAGCESCHGPGSLHSDSGGEPGTILNPRHDMRICFNCHLNTRAEFMSPSHHPLGDNRLNCSDCHNPHEGSAHLAGGYAMLSANDGCIRCHPSQRGPHVFEHEAVREGCTTCHRPHGSVNANLLTERNATLCLKCHFQQQTAAGQVYVGGVNHSTFLSQGTCWSAGCHEAVHGSQVNSSLRY